MRGCLLLLAFGVVVLPSRLLAKDELFLAVGKQHLITQEKKINRIAIGNAALLKIRHLNDNRELLLTGKTPGTTDLIVWSGRSKKNFVVHILSNDGAQLIPNLRSVLKTLEGVTLRQVGKEVWLEGELMRAADKALITKVTAANPLIRDLTVVHVQALAITVALLRERLRQAGFANIGLVTGGSTVFVEGTVASALELKRLQQTLLPLYPHLEWQIDTLYGTGTMILMDLKMVELRKQALKQIGVAWQKAATFELGAKLAPDQPEITLGLAEAIPVTIRTLAQKGLARVLANPRISCRYDDTCKFQAGGEIPIPLIGERYVNVIFKNYGIQLQMTPKRAYDDMLTIEIISEFSDVDFATAVNGIPGLLKNNLKTTASVRFHQSVVLSGLIQHRQSKRVDKMPVLASVPLLGELFKSRDFAREESEFLLFLTPRPMVAGDSHSLDLIDTAHDNYHAAEKGLRYDLRD